MSIEDSTAFWQRARAALGGLEPEAVEVPATGRVGAVLVLVEATDSGMQLVLTRRPLEMRSHPGQVSFPGGRVEDGETVEQAAVREACEEIALDPASVEVVGRGPSFYIPPSRFWIAPVLARWVEPHRLRANPDEVDAILHVPLTDLSDPARWRSVPLSAGGATWAWDLDGGDLLWGATAFLTAALLDVVAPGWSNGTTPDDLDETRSARPWEDMPRPVVAPRLAGSLPERSLDAVPSIDVATMRALDRAAFDVGWPLAAMAEHAGRGVAHAMRRLLAPRGLVDARITALVGTGGNGAGGLTAARQLAAAGADVTVLLLGGRDGVALPAQLAVADASGIAVHALGDVDLDTLEPGAGVVDAMVGYGAVPPLHGAAQRAARWLQRHDPRVVAVDLPSGVDGDQGLHGPGVTADVTVTLGLPKHGLLPTIVHPYVGDLYLADLGIPPGLWASVGVEVPADLFADGPLVRLVRQATSSDAGTPDQADPGRR